MQLRKGRISDDPIFKEDKIRRGRVVGVLLHMHNDRRWSARFYAVTVSVAWICQHMATSVSLRALPTDLLVKLLDDLLQLLLHL